MTHFISTFTRRSTLKLRDQLGGGDLGEVDRLWVGGYFDGRMTRGLSVPFGISEIALQLGDRLSRNGFPDLCLLKCLLDNFIGR